MGGYPKAGLPYPIHPSTTWYLPPSLLLVTPRMVVGTPGYGGYIVGIGPRGVGIPRVYRVGMEPIGGSNP